MKGNVEQNRERVVVTAVVPVEVLVDRHVECVVDLHVEDHVAALDHLQ